MTTAIALAVMVFASYRITRLITLDSILDRPRYAWWRRFKPDGPKPHPLGYLITCPFCAGFWVSAAVVVVAHLVDVARWPVRYDVLVVWAIAGGQSLLNIAEERIQR